MPCFWVEAVGIDAHVVSRVVSHRTLDRASKVERGSVGVGARVKKEQVGDRWGGGGGGGGRSGSDALQQKKEEY